MARGSSREASHNPTEKPMEGARQALQLWPATALCTARCRLGPLQVVRCERSKRKRENRCGCGWWGEGVRVGEREACPTKSRDTTRSARFRLASAVFRGLYSHSSFSSSPTQANNLRPPALPRLCRILSPPAVLLSLFSSLSSSPHRSVPPAGLSSPPITPALSYRTLPRLPLLPLSPRNSPIDRIAYRPDYRSLSPSSSGVTKLLEAHAVGRASCPSRLRCLALAGPSSQCTQHPEVLTTNHSNKNLRDTGIPTRLSLRLRSTRFRTASTPRTRFVHHSICACSIASLLTFPPQPASSSAAPHSRVDRPEMATIHPQLPYGQPPPHPDMYRGHPTLPPTASFYPPPGAPPADYHGRPGPPHQPQNSSGQSAPRQRTAIACKYCRRRKVSVARSQPLTSVDSHS